MDFYLLAGLIIFAAVYAMNLALLFLVNRWFKFFIEARKIRLGALVTTLVSGAGVAAGFYAVVWYLSATFVGDPGLGGMLFSAIGAILGGMIALGIGTYWFLRIVAGDYSLRAERVWGGLIVAVGLPLVYGVAGLLFIVIR